MLSWRVSRRPRGQRAGRIIQRAAGWTIEQLERRSLFSGGLTFAHDVSEGEPNNTAATANAIAVSTTPTVINGTIEPCHLAGCLNVLARRHEAGTQSAPRPRWSTTSGRFAQ